MLKGKINLILITALLLSSCGVEVLKPEAKPEVAKVTPHSRLVPSPELTPAQTEASAHDIHTGGDDGDY